jgi:hypothetical protein
MESSIVIWSKPRAAELLLGHCAALDAEREPPTAFMRLEAALGADLARRLVAALSTGR